MTDQLTTKLNLPMNDIRIYCQRWQIREFALFGSIIRDDFDGDSDIDVLVQFDTDVRYTFFDLVTMTDELEAIFGRKVDLIDRRALEESPNYIRRKIILQSAEVIYAE